MGDYYYYGHGGAADLDKAIRYYEYASKLNFPQVRVTGILVLF